jgi:hypothetical protein
MKVLNTSFAVNQVRKRMTVIVGLSLLSVTLWASHAEAEPPAYIAVEIRNDGVFIEGRHVSQHTPLSGYEAILGKSDRVTRLENTIYTYDQLGMILYQRPGEKAVSSISLDLVRSDYKFSPKSSFKGVLIVTDHVLRTDFPQSALLKLHGVEVDPSDTELSLSLTKATCGKNTLIFEYLSSRKELGGVGISWIAKD